jgi:putative transcriptional regulator
MKDEMFEELIVSVKEGGAILRGEIEPSRVFEHTSTDVKAIRARFGLSQEDFAVMLGISVKTLRNWEQGRRKPRGPARILLEVAARNPEVVWNAVRESGLTAD